MILQNIRNIISELVMMKTGNNDKLLFEDSAYKKSAYHLTI